MLLLREKAAATFGAWLSGVRKSLCCDRSRDLFAHAVRG